jgi:hypothetical protein
VTRTRFRGISELILSPDLDGEAVVAVENTWKERLHTRVPFGLNDN